MKTFKFRYFVPIPGKKGFWGQPAVEIRSETFEATDGLAAIKFRDGFLKINGVEGDPYGFFELNPSFLSDRPLHTELPRWRYYYGRRMLN